MDWITAIQTIWNDNSKLMILFLSTLISLLMMIIKNIYDNYKLNLVVLESSKIQLCLFLEVLTSAIIRGDSKLASQHNSILITNLNVIKKDNILYENYKRIHSFYLSLEMGNYKTSEEKESAIIELKKIKEEVEYKC